MKKNEYLITIFSKFTLVFFSLITSVILNRYLGPELKGEYAYILNVVNVLSIILSLGIGQSYTYFKRKYPENVNGIFVNIFYFQFLLYILIFGSINIFYINSTLNLILFISIITQFGNQISFLAIVNNLYSKNIVNILSALIYTILLILLIFMTNENLYFVMGVYIFKIILEFTILIYYNKFFIRSNALELAHVVKILKFGVFPMFTSLLIVLNYSMDTIILAQYVDFYEVGIYSVAVSLAAMLWLVPDAFKDVLFKRTATNDSIGEIVFGIKFNVYLAVLIIIGFSVIGRHFLVFMYGAEFEESFGVSVLLFIASIPMIFFKLINTLYISQGKQKFAFWVLSIAVLSNLLLNYSLIPFYGIEGAAIASIISYSVSGLIFLYSFIKKYDVPLLDIVIFSGNDWHKFKQIILKKKIS